MMLVPAEGLSPRALSSAELSLSLMHSAQPTSEFALAYSKGLHKSKYWEPVYEDSLNLIAKLPAIAAHIYRTTYKGGKLIAADPNLDWAANLSHMMGACSPVICASFFRACLFGGRGKLSITRSSSL